jgi:hypothetical protein
MGFLWDFPTVGVLLNPLRLKGWVDHMGGAGTPTCDIFDGIYVNDPSGLGGIGCAGLLWIVIGLTIIWRRLHEGSPSSGIWRLLGLGGDQIRVGKYV